MTADKSPSTLKLKDKTGVSRAYKIALENPSIGTVAALHETWIRFVETSIAALEQPDTALQEIREKVEAMKKNPDSILPDESERFSQDEKLVAYIVLNKVLAILAPKPSTTDGRKGT